MRITLPSFAKINWTLRVAGKRADGFHEVCTVMQTVSLHDTLTFEPANEISLTSDDPQIPIDRRNLILQAAQLLCEATGQQHGAAIHLQKRIPSPGGLAGGSSNAAAALVGLTRLWKLSKGLELNGLAARLGSDVPFFLTGGTALATGRGEEIEPIAEIEARHMLIVTPPVRVLTAEAYSSLTLAALTSEDRESILTVCRNSARSLDPLDPELTNDFERSVFAAYPEVERVKKTLLELGAANAAMSGSGASVFAVFDKKEARQAAEKALDSESTWRKFAVSTISRAEYREALGL